FRPNSSSTNMSVTPLSSMPQSTGPHDLAALKRGNLDPAEQRAAVAGQFEAILLRQILQESVASMMGGKNSNGGDGSVYGFMLTDTLASKLSEGRGMGIAPMIAKQLAPRGVSDEVANP